MSLEPDMIELDLSYVGVQSYKERPSNGFFKYLYVINYPQT